MLLRLRLLRMVEVLWTHGVGTVPTAHVVLLSVHLLLEVLLGLLLLLLHVHSCAVLLLDVHLLRRNQWLLLLLLRRGCCAHAARLLSLWLLQQLLLLFVLVTLATALFCARRLILRLSKLVLYWLIALIADKVKFIGTFLLSRFPAALTALVFFGLFAEKSLVWLLILWLLLALVLLLWLLALRALPLPLKNLRLG